MRVWSAGGVAWNTKDYCMADAMAAVDVICNVFRANGVNSSIS